MQQEQKELTFICFIIGLITGYIGETSDIIARDTSHNPSRNLFITIKVNFLNMSDKIHKAVENIVLRLINFLNCSANEKGGKGFYLERLNDHDHIYFAFDIFKKVHEYLLDYFNNNEIE